MACLEIVGGQKHLAIYVLKSLRKLFQVLLDCIPSSECCTPSLPHVFYYVLKCVSMDGFIVDCSRYLSYLQFINKSENALQSNQSEEVIHILKRSSTDVHQRF